MFYYKILVYLNFYGNIFNDEYFVFIFIKLCEYCVNGKYKVLICILYYK